MKYKVELLKDDTWQVVEYTYPSYEISPGVTAVEGSEPPESRTVMYQGSLADCNAWVQLFGK